MKPIYSLLTLAAVAIGTSAQGFAATGSTLGVQQSYKGVVARTIEKPRGHIYGVVNRNAEVMTTGSADRAFLGQLDLSSQHFSALHYGSVYAQVMGEDYDLIGSVYRKGILYVPNSITSNNGLSFTWYGIELETGKTVYRKQANVEFAYSAYSYTYNPDEDLIYGLTLTQDSYNNLVIIDPKKDFAAEIIGNLGTETAYMGIAYNPVDKQLYAFDENNIVTVNPQTANTTNMGYIDGLDYEIFERTLGSGLVVYSPMDQAFVTIYRDIVDQGNRVIMIDAETFQATEKNLIKGRDDVFIASIFCTDDYAPAEAPELAQKMTFGFDKASLSGTAAITVPNTTYYGDPIPADTKISVSLKVDGKELYTTQATPGQELSANLTLAQGLHEFALSTAIGSYVSPVRTQTKYIGNDTPETPGNFRMEGNHLTWTAPAATGINGGYVDVDNITYNVYIDGKLQNPSPLKATEYTFAQPETLARRDIEVKATAASMTSEAARINAVIGKARTLPMDIAPNKEDSSLFTVINANNDERAWGYTYNTNDQTEGMICRDSYTNDADDWLILPLHNFPSTANLYELSFLLGSEYKSGSSENFSIWLGQKPTAEGMTTQVYSITEFPAPATPEAFSVKFGVPEAGDYYVGIHLTSVKTNSYKGIFLTNFHMAQLAESSDVPGSPADIEIVPAPKGALHATVKATLPTVNLVGQPLAADKTLVMHISCGKNTAVSAPGLPGSQVSAEIDIPVLGYNNIATSVSNDNGEGLTIYTKRYIGIDTPKQPRNVGHTTSLDGRSMRIFWDKPEEEGIHGGFADADNLTYEIQMRTGTTVYNTVFSTKELWVNFELSDPRQSTAHVGPVATNAAGKSTQNQFVLEVLGKPYEIPAVEEFNSTKFTYGPYNYGHENEYKGSIFTSIKSDQASALGIGNLTFIQAGIEGHSEVGPDVKGFLHLPKFSTENLPTTHFVLRYWDYALRPTFTVMARSGENQEWVAIGKEPAVFRPRVAQFKDYSVEIPADYLNKGWVEFAVEVEYPRGDEYLVIDSYSLLPDTDYDLKLNQIEGPAQVTVGDKPSFNITVVNSGHERNYGVLKVELVDKAGSIVEQKNITVDRLNSADQATYKVVFEITGRLSGDQFFTVRATIAPQKDEITANNTTEYTVNLASSQVPVVTTLRTRAAADQTTLTWREPSKSYGANQDFELEEPFVVNAEGFSGGWKNVDLDKATPTTLSNGQLRIEWEGSDRPSAWTVVDPEALGFTSEERFKAHSGSRMLMARSNNAEQGDVPEQANDWLISPEIQGGSTISFFYNTLSESVSEYVELWYSSTGTELDPEHASDVINGDFRRIRTFSKVGPDGWDFVSHKLPDNAKYFALVYRSFDSLAAMIDDLTISPVKMQTWDIDHYSVWRAKNGEEPVCLVENTTERTFTDEMPDEFGFNNYYVLTHVNYNGKMVAGPKSNIATVYGTSVQEVETLEGVATEPGAIILTGLEDADVRICTVSGIVIANGKPGAPVARYEVLPGVYVVTTGNASTKIIVK